MYDCSDLHCEHRRTTIELSLFALGTLVFSRLQSGHWLLILDPNGRAPTCAHLKVIVLPG